MAVALNSDVTQELAKKGVIAEQDYAPNGIRLLFAVSLPQYRIFTVAKPVTLPPPPYGRVRFGGGEAESFISVTAAARLF